MVTKQEQLEWLANNLEKWKSGYDYAVVEETTDGHLYVRWPSVCTSGITKKEWQQEREKMSDKPEVDDSWFTYCKLPPCGIPVELWVGGTFAYNCEFIAIHGNTYVVWNLDADKPDCADSLNSEFRPVRTEREKMQKQATQLAQDNSWHERGELPPVGVPVELWVCGTFAYNCEFISKHGNNYVMWNLDRDRANSADCMHSQFHPLRTEREKAIDTACKAIDSATGDRLIIERLYDAGLLRSCAHYIGVK